MCTPLGRWMRENRLSDTALAHELGVHPSFIGRLRRGERFPSFPLMQQLSALSGGALTPNDFAGNLTGGDA